MKNFVITILLLFITVVSYCQPQTIYTVPNINALKLYYGTSTRLYVSDVNLDYVICNTCIVNDSNVFKGAGTRIWLQLFHDTTGAATIIAGGPITSLATLGFNPGTNIPVTDFIINTFYRSQVPTATLTGGQTLELRSTQTMNYIVNWTAGRQIATDSLLSVVVATVPQIFSQPAAGDVISGTQDVSFPANTDTTFQNVVTATDSKTATATTTFYFLPKRYFGWISDTTGIGTEGFDDSKITALGNELSASKIKSWNTGSLTGTQFYVYAYYATAGELSHFDMNGFPSLEAMNHVTRNFTNALGFTGQWIIYWNKNGQTLPSDIIAN